MKTETILRNEKIETKHSKGNEYDYSVPTVLTIKITDYTPLIYINNPGNCKVGTLMRLQDCMNADEETTIRRVKELFTRGSRKFGFKATFNNYESVEAVARHFEPLYIVKVPMVERSGHQYHVMFWTGRTDGPSFELYKSRIAEEKPSLLLNSTEGVVAGKSKVMTIKRQKLLTDAQKERILAYKRKDFMLKYVEKLINGETV